MMLFIILTLILVGVPIGVVLFAEIMEKYDRKRKV